MNVGLRKAKVFLALAISATLSLPLAAEPPSPAVVAARRAIFDPAISSVLFHNMDELFETRVVGHAAAPWQLPRTDAPMNFSYSYGGATKPASEILDGNYTNALLIIKDGKIVTEIYRNGTDAQSRFISWSMSKSLTGTLVGLAVSEGRIKSLDDGIVTYLPELRRTGYEGVTIRQILEMRSGVDYDERYDWKNPSVASINHEEALVQNRVRFADVARTLKRKHAPGSTFDYKTIDTAVLGWLVERVTGMSASAYMSSRIWERLGTERDAFYIMDGPPGIGREFTGGGFNATLRDYGRFGQMMLQDGVGNGQRILPAGWVRQATAPVGGQEGETGGYGYQWWTVQNSDAYFALGLCGQFIYVDPITRTVVVKLSYVPLEKGDAMKETLSFMAAASAWRP
ncbi:serine hydrolase [Sphingobium sp. LMC3-1-1.1]|uniref:serine hydrolase domain-containing protein n=1 Tax=Sphingobium sp. LMC3-1-1.1 TaxID=3135241 RepID=UPI003431CAC7